MSLLIPTEVTYIFQTPTYSLLLVCNAYTADFTKSHTTCEEARFLQNKYSNN